ncbi:orotate phosphoribosyltransferase [Candidatus Kaiserbacteria bacterium]|nr:orotate phosphoribosyltransferase [Candidatus Kaiserbacteria bacterium]
MMTESEVLDLLQKVGAFSTGHFVLTSGRHADSYLNKDALYPYTHDTSHLCKAMAERFADKDIDVVVGPAIGAAIISQWVAYHLTDMRGEEVYGAYADKDGQGGFILRRGYDQIVKGKRILIVEDLTTTGGSIKKVVETARGAGGNVVGAIVIVNRGGVTKAQVGSPKEFQSLVNLHLESWEESECELCKKGIPVNIDIGHGRDFMARNKA